MLPKYTIEYTLNFKKHAPTNHYSTDDPVACEEFVSDLLDYGMGVKAIKHEGLDLPRPEFDKIIKTAADLVVSKRICASLRIKPEEERHRFHFSA